MDHHVQFHLLLWFVLKIFFSEIFICDYIFFFQLSVTAICLFIILPLTAVGTVLGRNISGEPNDPCRTNAVPRPIPEKKWLEFLRFILFGLIIFVELGLWNQM
jgi:hypothetical protein